MTGPRLADILRNPTTVRVLKLALTALVVLALARHVRRTLLDLDARHLEPVYRPGWLAAAGGLYLLGLTAQGAYFARVVRAGPTPIGRFAAIRAYLISHLAKYVPGKAMVVVVRSTLAAEAGARPATAAFATLYETLVMMAAGGLVAAVGFATGLDIGKNAWAASRGVGPNLPSLSHPLVSPNQTTLIQGMLSLGAGVGFLVLVAPTVFPRVAALIRKPLRGVGADALPRLSGRLLVEGLGWSALGWTLLGLSQVAVIAGVGIGSESESVPPMQLWPMVVASVALATVAGFAVPIAPGGLGIREWVLWTTLGSALSDDRAVVAALVLRLVWVVAEVVAAGVLLPIRPRARSVDA